MIALLTLLNLFVAVTNPPADVLTVKGSDTMVILVQRWAEQFMKERPGKLIQVTGGGSGTGISALINGTTDVCASSRPMKPSEVQKLKARNGRPGVEIKVARDGIAIYLNEKNPVKELTLSQIRRIYTGSITNWKQVGGNDARIILYSRENSSGTYAFFKEEVLGSDDFAQRTMSLPGTASVVAAIAKDPNGIGYGGIAYGRGITEIAVKKDDRSPATKPTKENILSGEYPISRFLYFYLTSRPQGLLKEFIDFSLSAEGQKLVADVGYISLK